MNQIGGRGEGRVKPQQGRKEDDDGESREMKEVIRGRNAQKGDATIDSLPTGGRKKKWCHFPRKEMERGKAHVAKLETLYT